MKTVKKIFKWIGLSIGSLILLLILAGLAFRAFGPAPHQPQGEMIDIGDFSLHIIREGEKSDKPTLVIESGAGSTSAVYHWLSEGLKDSMRVIRYDRAGVGYSDACITPRTPETIAHELHTLLEESGEEPPYILAGHSLGGPYIRVFAQLYPNEVAGMFFLDSTHPEQAERLGAAKASSFKYTVVKLLLDLQAIAGDLGIIGLLDQTFGPLLSMEGLPEEINARIPDFLLDGKSLRGYSKEIKEYHSSLKRAGEANDFGALPIRVITAIEIDSAAYFAAGIDPEERLAERIKAQKEFTELSSNGKQILIDGNHNSIYTKKEKADIICKEVLQLLRELQ